jgi:DNA-binding PadR family transcriptional regulator
MTAQPLTIEHALLGFVRQGAAHGYAIYQALSDPAGLGLVWNLKQSQLYALLGKLEDAGYLVAEVEKQESRPSRKLYSLTSAGENAFLAWLSQPVEHGRHLRLEFLAKLYFARIEGREAALALVEKQRHVCQRWLAAQQAQANAAGARPYDRLVHQFRQGQIEAMLAWLDHCAQVATESPQEPARS